MPSRACCRLDSLIAPGSVIEKIADGFTFTEGPLCDGTFTVTNPRNGFSKTYRPLD